MIFRAGPGLSCRKDPLPRRKAVSTTKTRLDRVSLVCVPASDQDRAVDFYVDKLGFEKRTDVPFGGDNRWIEVYPPNGPAGIALAPPRPGAPGTPRDTGIAPVTHDIDMTHSELKAACVDIGYERPRQVRPG